MARAMFQITGSTQMFPTPTQNVTTSKPGRRSSSTVRITNVMSAQSQSPYWASVNIAVEAYLKKSIPLRQPLTVFEPMRHLVLDAPPSAAPALCVAACEAVGGTREQAMAAAAAVRLIHAATCTHDELLSTHKPSSRTGFGSNIKLMTGDGIVPFGFELLARNGSPDPDPKYSGRILRVITEIARAAGAQGMVEGQYEEVLCSQAQTNGVKPGRMERAWEKKEGELHACAGACGAILGGGTNEEVETLRRYGRYVGTIQGMVNWGEFKGREEMIEEIKKLALNELKDLNNGGNIGPLAKLVELDFCHA